MNNQTEEQQQDQQQNAQQQLEQLRYQNRVLQEELERRQQAINRYQQETLQRNDLGIFWNQPRRDNDDDDRDDQNLNISLNNLNKIGMAQHNRRIYKNVPAPSDPQNFNLLNFQVKNAYDFIKQKVMFSNNMQPHHKQDLLILVSLSRDRGALNPAN